MTLAGKVGIGLLAAIAALAGSEALNVIAGLRELNLVPSVSAQPATLSAPSSEVHITSQLPSGRCTSSCTS
jgi:hypothetical protein